MAADLSDLLAAVKGTGPPGASALAGIYAGSTAHFWSLEFQFLVSSIGAAMLGFSAIWFAGIIIGRLTDWAPLRRLEGTPVPPQLPPPPPGLPAP